MVAPALYVKDGVADGREWTPPTLWTGVQNRGAKNMVSRWIEGNWVTFPQPRLPSLFQFRNCAILEAGENEIRLSLSHVKPLDSVLKRAEDIWVVSPIQPLSDALS